jgi:hypothetical protein
MTLTEIKELVAFLRTQGVTTFEGNGVKLELSRSAAPAAEIALRPLGSIESILEDPDLFAHEAGS